MVTDYFFVYSYFFPSWTMKFQKIKIFWDVEIIGNRRKKVLWASFTIFHHLALFCKNEAALEYTIFEMTPTNIKKIMLIGVSVKHLSLKS